MDYLITELVLFRKDLKEKLTESIDYTFLKNVSDESLKKSLDSAIENNFKHICTYPNLIGKTKEYLSQRFNDITICSVAGFPYYNGKRVIKNSTHQKITLEETEFALKNGAKEIDIFWDITLFKAGLFNYVKKDIEQVVNLVKEQDSRNIVKVIVETCNLDKYGIINACKIVSESGADFIKTSTGFDRYGARIEDVELMSKTIDNLERKIAIKASGGIETLQQSLNFLDIPYVERLGVGSAAPKILKEVDEHIF